MSVSPVEAKTLRDAIQEALTQDAYLQFMWSHATRFAALLVSVVIVFKIFAVAHFDSNVAITLATVSSVPATLLSLVVSFAPIVVAILGFTSWLIANDFWAGGERRWLVVLPAIALTVVSLALTPWILFVYLGGLGLYLVGLFTLARAALRALPKDVQAALLAGQASSANKRTLPLNRLRQFMVGFANASSVDAHKVLARIGRNIILGLLGAIVAIVATYDLPWLPAEQVTFGDGTRVVGFVLAVSSDSITLLRDDDRTVIIRPSSGAARLYCRKSSVSWDDWQASRSVLQFVFDRVGVPLPQLPVCKA